MSDNRAYTKTINPVGSSNGEYDSIHQASPTWVLTFVRWENRDPLRVKSVSATDVRDPLVVENDCLSVSVTSSKGSLTPSMTATLVMTDVNYETAVAPGDFVAVNMLNWPEDARKLADKARAKQSINGINDGFKGMFKVQSVRRTLLVVDPTSGAKAVVFKITGFAFTEFNNVIYFNPYLIDPNQDPKNQLLFASFIGKDWTAIINEKGLADVQNVIAVLIQSFIGAGIAEGQNLTLKRDVVQTPNVHFFIPELVGALMGIKGARAAKDVYSYLFGLQKYASGTSVSLADGMNPIGLTERFGKFYYTPSPCKGNSLLKPEYWNQVKAWSIINQYTNAPINEIYTCFRVSPAGKVLPTLVFRQIPFTTEDYSGPGEVTRFMNLPRWKINPALILEEDIGREEAARINFVQYFGRSTLGAEGADISQEIAQGNYVYDIDDVQRSGLRPYIVTTQFDDPTSVNKDYRSPVWAKILGDTLIGSHLKLNGSLQVAGIVDPIAVGDNLELDGIVYHIEQVTHSCSISPQNGIKMFRTTINLSSGLSASSSASGTRYGEMDFTRADKLRENDIKNNQLLPGVSESQDTVYRLQNTETDDPGHRAPNRPFAQPKTRKGTDTDEGDKT